jgi:hypothetical protein
MVLSRRSGSLALFAAIGFLAAGTARTDPAVAPREEQNAVAQTVFLIGDGGKPARSGEPVLIALRRDVAPLGSRATVVFLGDNVYPSGLPGPGAPDRAEMERRLDDQVDAVRDTGARVVFIPGNHDWKHGLEGLRRQERRVEARGGPNVVFLPRAGCPGPDVLDVGVRLRLVLLDTHWWLQRGDEAGTEASDCPVSSEQGVTAALRGALEGADGRETVVAMHHPLVSGGPHGGRFGLRQHLFPLTDIKKWAWLPLPVIGSIYPIARSSGISSQDQSSGAYRDMTAALVAAAQDHLPLAWASGHEHVLQVIERTRFGRMLVSGGGYYGHVTQVRPVEGARYQAARSGYMRIDLLEDGGRRLTVVEVSSDAETREAFTAFLG